jgi:hypothetical protein
MAVIRPKDAPAVTTVAAGDIFLIDGATGVRALAASVVPLRDVNGNVTLNNAIEGFASTVTAAGTTTLTAASAAQQFFTGTLAQTVVLPVVSTLAQTGQGFFFQNASTGALTIQSSGLNSVAVLAPGTSATITCVALTGTSAASWQAIYFGTLVASGKVLTVSSSLALVGTDGTTQTFPTTSATLARTDTGQTFTGTNAFGVLTATSFNGNTITTGTGVLTLATGKTLTASNTLTLAGTDGSTASFGAGGTVAYQGGTLAQFAATTSAQLRGVLSDETGTGSAVFATSPTLVTPVLGAATATSINGNTWTAGTGILTIAAAKTLTASNSLTLAGTDGTTQTFPATSATIARTDAGQTFTGTNAFGVLTATSINGNTFTAGTGVLTIAAAKTLTVSNSLTLAGTDGTTQTFPSTSGTVVTSSSVNAVTNAMRAQMAAATLKGNATAALANEADFTIQGLTNLGAPSATLDFIPIYNHVTGTIQNVTPGAIASSAVAGVSSIAGNTGVFTLGGLLTNSTNLLQVVAAAKSDQQTGTSAVLAVTPSQQQSHASAAKAWAIFSGSGTNGAQTINASYNAASVTRSATGFYTIAWTTPFATANYSFNAILETTAGTQTGWVSMVNGSRTTSQIEVVVVGIVAGTATAFDPVTISVQAFGGQ